MCLGWAWQAGLVADRSGAGGVVLFGRRGTVRYREFGSGGAGLVRSGKVGKVRCGRVRSGSAWQASLGTVR